MHTIYLDSVVPDTVFFIDFSPRGLQHDVAVTKLTYLLVVDDEVNVHFFTSVLK